MMARSDYQLAVSIVVILAASILLIVLVALLNRGKNTGRNLEAARRRLAGLRPEQRKQGLGVPGLRVTFSQK